VSIIFVQAPFGAECAATLVPEVAEMKAVSGIRHDPMLALVI
jgi:hypothetical protein